MELNSKWQPDSKVEFADMPWSDAVYIALDTSSGFANIIIKRKDLEKFMKASKPAKKKKKKPTTQEKLKALKIGTRFKAAEDGAEYIKIGKEAYIETDEKLAIEAMKSGVGFLQAEHFWGKITVVDD